MNSLKINNENKTLTSLEVAEMVEKEHKKLLRDIRTYVEQLTGAKIGPGDFFLESSYIDKNNQERPCYLITKKGCEFIANKLTGKKGTIFTATYINRFNEMEQQLKPKSTMEILKLEFQAIEELEAKVDRVRNDFEEFKHDMPLLALEIEKITNARNRVAVSLLGGKESPAYLNKTLRGKVYSDLSRELKRQLGISTYKAIKRKDCNLAIEIIDNHSLPKCLEKEIRDMNSQQTFGKIMASQIADFFSDISDLE